MTVLSESWRGSPAVGSRHRPGHASVVDAAAGLRPTALALHANGGLVLLGKDGYLHALPRAGRRVWGSAAPLNVAATALDGQGCAKLAAVAADGRALVLDDAAVIEAFHGPVRLCAAGAAQIFVGLDGTPLYVAADGLEKVAPWPHGRVRAVGGPRGVRPTAALGEYPRGSPLPIDPRRRAPAAGARDPAPKTRLEGAATPRGTPRRISEGAATFGSPRRSAATRAAR